MNKKKENQHFNKLAQPAQRALANSGITNLSTLAQWIEPNLIELHGIGKNALKILKEMMESEGLTFKI